MRKSPSFAFGTVGAPRSTPARPGGSKGAIMRLAELGLSAFELGWVQSVRVTEKTCEEIRTAAGDYHIALSVHAPYFINLNADSKEWPKSRKRLMDAAHYGYLAGATDIVFHPGSYLGQSPEEVLDRAIPRLRQCIEELRSHGNPVVLRPETMGKRAMLGSLEDVLSMSHEIEGVEPCIDFSHLHARTGDGTRNSQAEWKAVLARLRKALGAKALRRLHCHVSGIEYGEKGERKHLMLDESDMDYVGLLTALRDTGGGGRILCESPVMEEDALSLMQVWGRIRREAGGPA